MGRFEGGGGGWGWGGQVGGLSDFFTCLLSFFLFFIMFGFKINLLYSL